MAIELAQHEDGPGTALAPVADAVTQALAEVTAKNTSLTELAAKGRELAARFRGVAWDVRTTKGMDEAKKARLELREQVRYPMQELQKAGSKLLGAMQRQFNDRARDLIAEVEMAEAPIHEQIQAEEQRKEHERAEREAAEQRRRQGHIDAIAAVSRHVVEAMGEGSAELRSRIAGLSEMIVDESWEEYQGQAQQAKDEALRQLQGMLVAALAEEAELEETRRQQAALAAAQAELQAQQRAQAERDRQLAERERALAEKEAQQKAEAESLARARAERAEAVQRRIDAIATAGPAHLDQAPSELIAGAIHMLQSLVLSEELLDDRLKEAALARVNRLHQLELAHIDAQAREAEEARQQQAARIEELIAGIRAMGETAAMAVQDGSADAAGLRAGLEELRSTDLSPEVFGDRVEEATRVLTVAASAIEGAIIFTVERDRLAAEEAERQRIERKQQMAALALRDAKRAHGEELYEILRNYIIIKLALGGELDPAMKHARAALLLINPAETFED